MCNGCERSAENRRRVRLRILLPAVADRFGAHAHMLIPAVPIGSTRMRTCLFPRCRSVRRACAHAYSRGADRFDAHAHMLIPAVPIGSTRMRTCLFPRCRSIRRACAHATGCYQCSSSIERLPTFGTVTTPFIL